MNTVAAFGENENVCTLAEDVVNFCIAKLMPRMRTLDICINVDEELEIFGYCLAVDKREFVIDVKGNASTLEFIETLCHEMVHVKQYARGELAIDGKMEYKTQEDYENVWYEKEAYTKEKELTADYIKYFFGK